MAAKKRTTRARGGTLPVDRNLEVVGDARTAPITIREEGRPPFRPDLALWIDVTNGAIWGSTIGEPGQRAATLLEALRSPGPPPYGPRRALPGRLVVFDQALAGDLRAALADDRIRVDVAAPSDEFDAAFAEFFSFLEENERPTSGLPDEVLAPLCRACAALWRHKPWQYMDDEPAVEIRPQAPGYEPRIACVLGAIDEVYGVALYASYDDYRRFVAAGEQTLDSLESPPLAPAADSASVAAADAERTARLTLALHERSVLVSFDAKRDVQPEYHQQLVRNGWSRRLAMVPTFSAIGGGDLPGEPAAGEARQAALAIEALVAFCEAHEDEIAQEDFPLAGAVEVAFDGRRVPVAVSIPPESGRRAPRSRPRSSRRRG